MDKKDVRSGNIALLRNLLKSMRQATKPQLAKASGLSVVTVNAIMKVLTESGEAVATEVAPSTGGRKALIYVFRADRRLSLTAYTTAVALPTDEESAAGAGNLKLTVAVHDIFGEKKDGGEFMLNELTPAALAEILLPFTQKYPQIPMLVLGFDGKTATNMEDAVDYRDIPFDRQLTAKLERQVKIISETEAAAANAEHFFGKPVAEGVVVTVNWPLLMPPVASIMIGGEIFRGRDGIAGAIGRRFFGTAYHKPLDIVREAARTIVTLTRVLNPHGIILYGEDFADDTAAAVTERAVREIPEKYLPNFAVRQDIAEDYAAGIVKLAGKYLAALDDE